MEFGTTPPLVEPARIVKLDGVIWGAQPES